MKGVVMGVQETKEFLRDVFSGKIALRALLGRKYEGHFGEYHLSGVITSVRQQGNRILINWVKNSPSLEYIEGTGVEFHIGDDENFLSPDFILE